MKYGILSELGRYNEALLEGPVWSIGMTMRAMGKNDEDIEQFPNSPVQVALAMEAQGRLQEVIDRFPDPRLVVPVGKTAANPRKASKQGDAQVVGGEPVIEVGHSDQVVILPPANAGAVDAEPLGDEIGTPDVER